MTREAYAARLEYLHPIAAANPRAYQRRVQAWAWLGYGFIMVLLLGTLASMVGILSLLFFTTAFALILKLGAALGYFAWKIIRSLWVTFDEPAGRPLTPAEAAPLFALVAQQAGAMQAPAVHRVLLTTEFNASIVQLPRLGVLGWPRNYLMVGLPLLQAMTAEQAGAVVAHELGHLRGGHGRFGAWVYRVSQSWEQLLAQMERSGSATWLHRFTNWYVPQFNAWSHPLRRTAEFEADAAAARVTSPQAMAQALCALVGRDTALDRLHWDVLSKDVATRPFPPADAITRLLPVAKSARLDDTTEAELLATAMAADADVFDTHPSLPERLAALGQEPCVPELPAVTAAEAWFGPALPSLAAELDAKWAIERQEWWKERHQALSKQRQRLDELNDRLQAGEVLSGDEAWEHADLTEDHVSSVEALPLFQSLFDDAQHGLGARFAAGRILAGQDDPAGLELLDEVMAREPNARAMGLLIQEAYHKRRGDKAEARRLQTEQLRHADTIDMAVAERETIRSTDRFQAHGLTAEQLAAFQTGLAVAEGRMNRAWLLQKELTIFTDHPLFVLVVEPAAGRKAKGADVTPLVQDLAKALVFPGEGFVVPLVKENEWLTKYAQMWPDTLIYPVR